MICEKHETENLDSNWGAFDVEPRYYSKHAQCIYQTWRRHVTIRLKMNGKEYITDIWRWNVDVIPALSKGAYP